MMMVGEQDLTGEPLRNCAVIGGKKNQLTNNFLTCGCGKRMIEVDFQQESGGCEVGLIPYGVCKNDQQRVRLVGELPACRFPVHFQDVVFGVWHSLNTEQNLVPLIQVCQWFGK